MIGFIKWFIKMFVAVFVVAVLFGFYGYVLIRMLKFFNVQDYLSEDNLVIAMTVPTLILTFGTINFCKSSFQKLQQQK